jgi:hypothetical protein
MGIVEATFYLWKKEKSPHYVEARCGLRCGRRTAILAPQTGVQIAAPAAISPMLSTPGE